MKFTNQLNNPTSKIEHQSTNTYKLHGIRQGTGNDGRH